MSRLAIAEVLLWAGLVLLHPAGASGESAESPAGVPSPPRVAVEEILRQVARITWSDEQAGKAARYRLERRERAVDGVWGDWIDVPTAADSGRLDHIHDAGPDGKGLRPADYEYRMQGAYPGSGGPSAPAEWSEWSAPTAFTMPPQCAGGDKPPGNEAPGSLPTVEIRDLDGDGRFSGADVWLAMQRCSKLGGCILQALPVTYDDVAISLWGQNDRRPCVYWNALVCEPMPPFPNGLVIQGHGSATVFRSPVWRTPYKPSAVLEVWHAPGVQLRFRNFVLDGRKREQPVPTPGVNDQNLWRHKGLDISHYFGPDHRLGYPDGCVHNVTARDFLSSGIDVDHARNWRIEYNRVQDVGCWGGLTECPALTIPDTNPPPGWGCDGLKVTGTGLVIGLHTEDTLVAHNEITRVTKYALDAKGGGEGTDPITRLSIYDNRITNVGTVGIFLAGTIDSVAERNLVDGTHAYGCRDGNAWFSWGIQTHGTLRNTRIRENALRNLASVGIGSNATADGLVFSDNQIENVCMERDAKVGSVWAAIQFHNGSAGTFTLAGNSVKRNHCSMVLAVGVNSRAQVIVDGGYYSTAENSDATYGAVYVESMNPQNSPRVTLKGGVIFDYLGDERRPGIVASGNGRVVVLDDSVLVKGYRKPFNEMITCMNKQCTSRKSGTIVECASSPSSPECR
jgi:Right handed beta helix region